MTLSRPHRVAPAIQALAALLLAMSAALAPAAADERPGPFVFMHGLQGTGAAEIARSLGCNTVYLDLPADAPLHLDEIRELIAEARAAKLHVIVGLRTRLVGELRVSVNNPAYVSAVREWLEAVVGALHGEAIAAWATDHYLERDISATDTDFQAFLLERHGSIDAINAHWGSRFMRIDDITREAAREHDDTQMHGVGRASVDFADHEVRAFHDVMALWAAEIRRLSPQIPLMTGRISLYRSLVAIPDAYDIVQPFMPPDILEPDVATHNVHAVQMARRGGRFDVIPWLRLPLPPSQAYAQSALYAWVLEAGLRGAVGVGLEDWSRIEAPAWVRRNLVDQLNAALAQAPFSGDRPLPTTAVIHAPYAGGHEFAGTPAYGFITDYPVNDLATLAFSYRFGSIFGGVDYLRVEDLAGAELGGYSAVLAPATLALPPAAASALVRYVEGGGALFADLGLGMYQSGSWNPADSPLAAVMGIAGAVEPDNRYGSFSVIGEPFREFPSLAPGAKAGGSFVPGEGVSRTVGQMSRYTFEGAASQMRGYPFQGPSWFVRLGASAFPLATQSVRYDSQERPHFLGPVAARVGAGLALFTPFEAWSFWPPSDAVHAALHCDLMNRRARYRLLSDTLVDPAVGLSGSDDWLHLLGRRETGVIRVLAGSAAHRAYIGATCTFSAAGRSPDGRRSGVVTLSIELPVGALRHYEAIPVTFRPAVGQAHVRITAYAPGLVASEIGGHGAVWGRERRDLPERFHSGQPTRIRVGVENGLYPLTPGSSHQVTLSEGRDHSDSMIVVADHRGSLDFWVTATGGQLTIMPVAQ